MQVWTVAGALHALKSNRNHVHVCFDLDKIEPALHHTVWQQRAWNAKYSDAACTLEVIKLEGRRPHHGAALVPLCRSVALPLKKYPEGAEDEQLPQQVLLGHPAGNHPN